MTSKKDMLDVLRHSRHDWLNVIQLIKGYLALERYDRIEEVLEIAIQQALNESKLSNLSIPNVSCYLLTFNWLQPPYTLEFEVMGEVTDLQSIEQELESLVRAAADLFKAHCSLERENHLLLTFQLFPDFLRLTFDFQGKLCRLEELETALKHVLQKREDSFELREEECVFSVCFEKK